VTEISKRLLPWFDEFGRKHLPWQQKKTPYKVWISEIMLQQTQVATVIPYFERFMESFPDIQTLAKASEDEVLAHWSGLGYYARARNLHKCAKQICAEYEGKFPENREDVINLPGIGKSTAGAILSLSLHQAHAILDGNVKRVLSRVYMVDGWYGQTAVEKKLWGLAEENTPVKRVADYNQAMMDLGATLCVRGKNVDCNNCPLLEICKANEQGLVSKYPESKPKKKLPVRKTVMLLACDEKSSVLIEKRPPSGIWGGLWSLPEYESIDELKQGLSRLYEYDEKAIQSWGVMRHTFSHYHLDIQPIRVDVKTPKNIVMEDNASVWYKPGSENDRGFPTPVSKLINKISKAGELI